MTAPNVEKLIGQYRILRTLGAGGMGTVYLGEHLLLGRRAAIKTLLPALSSQREIVDRFFNEARAISAISDPGVVQVFDFGYHVDGTAYIVMELLEGESLAARLERVERLPLVEALRLGRQLASSLAAAHEREVIHRDLKPGNVFVIRDAEVPGGERTKILDFGICKIGDDATTTQTGTMLGTPVYMSPEQCRGAGLVDRRSDIYSLGCVLFHMITGRPPFDCEAVGEYIAAHLKEPAPAPSSIADAIPPEVDAVLARCLAKEPDQRFSSMIELQQELEHALATVSDHGVAAPEPPHPMTPLGEGFQSAFDVNAGDGAGETPPPPARSWFVDSQLPAPAEDDDDFIQPRRSRWGRGFAFLLALGLGLAGGLAGTGYVMEMQHRERVAAPAAPAIPAREPVETPSIAIAHVSAPPPAVAGEDEEPQEAPRAPQTRRQAERSQRRQHAKSTRPRRVDREPEPPPPPEDLYDSR